MTTTFTTTLDANASIEAQIGNLHGDAVFHRTTIYQANKHDTPERQLEVAVNHLRAGGARMAEGILLHLMKVGHEPGRTAYYTALAVISGRTTRDFGAAERDTLTMAANVGLAGNDEWARALSVVTRIVTEALALSDGAAGHGQPVRRSDSMALVAAELAKLPRDRYAEVTRHIARLVEDVESDHVVRERLEFAERQRYEGDRVNRAWLFFEPEPQAPVPDRVLRPRKGFKLAVWCTVLGGLVVLFAGTQTFTEDTWAAALLMFLGAGAAGVGLTQFLSYSAMRDVSAERLGASAPRVAVSTFYLAVARLVIARFDDVAVNNDPRWAAETAGLRWAVAADFADTYARYNTAAVNLNWLIRKRVDDIAARWHAGGMDLVAQRKPVPPLAWALIGVGVVLGFVGLTMAGPSGTSSSSASGASSLFAASLVGLFAAAYGIGRLLSQRFAVTLMRQGTVAQHAEDMRFLQQYENERRSAPDDTEIGDWLAGDLLAVQTLGMRRLGLSRHDVLAHLVLTEGTRHAIRTRVPYGIPRYSTYRIRHLYFTDNGVREFVADLDMFTGTIHNEQRTSFRYEALVSAKLGEGDARFVGQGRMVLAPGLSGPGVDNPQMMLRNQVLAVSLVSGESSEVTVEDFTDLADTHQETPQGLREIALTTSGVATALRVLESVAGEGLEWTARERDRRARMRDGT